MNAPSQPRLYHEDFWSAFDEDMRALGGRKAVAIMLRPDLAHRPHEAHVWINNCMNPERRERLHDDHIRFVMRKAREVSSFAAMHFWCDDAGFERTRPLSPAGEIDKLHERGGELLREMRALTVQMERLQQSGALRPVPAAKTATG